MAMREFDLGDPEIPACGLLIGGGGGIAGSFRDAVVDGDGVVRVIQYELQEGSGRIPEKRNAIQVFSGDDAFGTMVKKYLRALDSMGFWKLELKPFPDDTFRYLVAIEYDLGLKFVEWSWPGDGTRLPEEFEVVYDGIRSSIFEKIAETF